MEGFLSHSFNNKKVKIISINFDDISLLNVFQNIGIFPGVIIDVKSYKFNRKNLHILVNDVEYAIRLSDAKNIFVRSIDAK